MNKSNMFIFIVILVCFVSVNIVIQLVLNEGYTTERVVGDRWVPTGHMSHPLSTRLVPIVLSLVLFSMVFFGISDRDDPWMIWVNKKRFGEK